MIDTDKQEWEKKKLNVCKLFKLTNKSNDVSKSTYVRNGTLNLNTLAIAPKQFRVAWNVSVITHTNPLKRRRFALANNL